MLLIFVFACLFAFLISQVYRRTMHAARMIDQVIELKLVEYERRISDLETVVRRQEGVDTMLQALEASGVVAVTNAYDLMQALKAAVKMFDSTHGKKPEEVLVSIDEDDSDFLVLECDSNVVKIYVGERE